MQLSFCKGREKFSNKVKMATCFTAFANLKAKMNPKALDDRHK